MRSRAILLLLAGLVVIGASSPAMGQTYTLCFYNTAATTAIFQYKNNPSQPFTVASYFSNVRSRSSAGDAFPVDDNSWAPFIRVVAIP